MSIYLSGHWECEGAV